jgi:hypothetical protein
VTAPGAAAPGAAEGAAAEVAAGEPPTGAGTGEADAAEAAAGAAGAAGEPGADEAATGWAPEAAEEPVPLAIPGEQIEWQPVVTGEQIEWQPVVVSDAEAAWSGEAPPSQADDAYAADAEAYPYQGGEPAASAGWDPTAVPVAGNGSDGTAAPTTPAPAARAPGRRGPPPPPTAAGDAGEATRSTRGGPPPNAKRQVLLLSVLTVVVLLIAVLGFVLSRGASKKGGQASGPTTTSVSVVTVPPADLVTFHDDQTGFTVKYPKTWKQLGAPVSDIRLTLDAGGNDGVQIRIFPIQTPATTDNIANLKAVTDTIVFGDQTAGRKEIQEQLVTLNGKLTYYYIFTYPDPVTEQEGVHVTYFVFEGHRMFEMVFQAVPADDFQKEAGIFDQIAESFTVDPEKPTTTAPASAPSTTTPPTSTP